MSIPLDNNTVHAVMNPFENAAQYRNICQLIEKTPLKRNDSVTSNPSGQLSHEEIQRQGGLRV